MPKLPVVLLICALAGVLGGAAIIGLPALGGALIFDSLLVGWFAWNMDDGAAPQAHQVTTLKTILDRERSRAS